MRSYLTIVTSLVSLTFLLTSGCSKDELTGMIDKAKGVVEEKVEPIVADLGMIKLNFGQSVETRECHARLFSFNSNRPSVFQITSYETPQDEQSPSVMLTAQVDADALDKLLDQTIEAEVFVSPSNGGEVWHSGTSSLVAIRITSVGNNRVSGEIVSGSLGNAASGEESPVTGNFEGVVK